VNKTCPKCAADYNGRPAPNQHDYWCGSTTWNDGDFYQSPECVRRERDQILEQSPSSVRRERDQLLERNRKLVKPLEVLVCASEDVQSKGYAFAQLDGCVVTARVALAKAKETKP